MSGGPYGRGKAPERACLKVEFWPEEDARLWTIACARGDILDDEIGSRADYSAISNDKDRKGYGRWLNHLGFHDRQALRLAPADRITPDRVKAYVARLEELGLAALQLREALVLVRDRAELDGVELREALAPVVGVLHQLHRLVRRPAVALAHERAGADRVLTVLRLDLRRCSDRADLADEELGERHPRRLHGAGDRHPRAGAARHFAGGSRFTGSIGFSP